MTLSLLATERQGNDERRTIDKDNKKVGIQVNDVFVFYLFVTVFNVVCPLTYHFLQLFIVGNTYLFISFDRGTVTKMYMLHAKYFSKNRYNATPLQAVRYIQFSAFLFEKNYSMTTLPVN